MKKLVANLMKSAIIAALVLASNSTYAVGDVKVAPISGSKKARVYVATAQGTNVHLTVLNQNGTEYLYKENLTDDADYNKVYDFDLLEEGTYKIVAESDSKIVEKEITISKEGIKVIGENEIYKPYFNLEEGKLTISYLNMKENDVVIKFSDKKDVFFSDKGVQDINFMKSYSLANLEEGEYVVYLSSGKESYSYFFEVK